MTDIVFYILPLCTAWDIAYRYELEGEVEHQIVESFEDEYDYYPAEYWVNDPEYSYPDGEINVTGTEAPNGDVEEGGEVVLPE